MFTHRLCASVGVRIRDISVRILTWLRTLWPFLWFCSSANARERENAQRKSSEDPNRAMQRGQKPLLQQKTINSVPTYLRSTSLYKVMTALSRPTTQLTSRHGSPSKSERRVYGCNYSSTSMRKKFISSRLVGLYGGFFLF